MEWCDEDEPSVMLTSAFLSRQRRKEQEDQNRDLLEKKTRECNELSDRCHELEAQ